MEPTAALLAARRGTALFSRAIADLRDRDLDEPTAIPGWHRRDIMSYVGYHARRMAYLVDRVTMYVSEEAPEWVPPTVAEVRCGASMSAIALRNLHTHAAVHLDVEWRDVRPVRWSTAVVFGSESVTLSELVWMRAQTVWFGAVSLDTGVSERQVPDEVRLYPDPETGVATAPWTPRTTD